MASPETSEERIERLLKEARALPESPGVYIYHNADGEEIYVGKALSLRSRVKSYFEDISRHDAKTAALVAEIDSIEILPTESEVEALLLENRLIKELQPRYNISLKDSKTFPYLVITWSEEYPRVYISREAPRTGDRFYGPFVSAKELRAAVSILQRVFRFCTCKVDVTKNKYARPCLNYHIGRCYGARAGLMPKEEYRELLRRFSMFISGKRTSVLEDMQKKMKSLSAEMKFEEAAAIRDQIRALESLGERGSLKDASHPVVAPIDLAEGLDELQKVLHLKARPRLIEGMDISNLGSGEMAGSVVSFVDGIPQRGGYRRFRIKTVVGQDDFASLREVAARRYSKLLKEGSPLPDIILVDGGMGQLNSVKQVLEELGLTSTLALLSLAKQEEIVFSAETQAPVPLGPRSAAKRLLMYVRDEAHRFAQYYHHILRRKFVLGEEKHGGHPA
jgi:excinuclease ABC subunit C